ncbi:hypothetical protein [Bacillus cereus]|uniref:hypothetical protein n=1 Tax=Bacillus cereus TaxID=1396 RepID=UPI003D659493
MRYHIIESLKGKYPVIWLTKFAGVHRSSYYKWIHTKSMKNMRLESEKRLKKGFWCKYMKKNMDDSRFLTESYFML